jgi:hypothetical protein
MKQRTQATNRLRATLAEWRRKDPPTLPDSFEGVALGKVLPEALAALPVLGSKGFAVERFVGIARRP